ncbi:MAG TPA: hypothetical protein VFN30_14375 [Chitinophagaceae bacterium]|nr:hypothetical protein [Chitinophagaceae bacterium]
MIQAIFYDHTLSGSALRDYFLVVSAAAVLSAGFAVESAAEAAVLSTVVVTAVESALGSSFDSLLQATKATIAKANNAFFIMMIFKVLK